MEPIDLDAAKKMVDHYQTTRKTIIDKEHSINDTQSIWLPIDKLKDFVNKLPDHATGVRIHLAAYDHDHEHYPNQTTAILTGTVAHDNTEHADVMAKGQSLMDQHDESLGAYNQGKICPPFC